jgi:hypothetical protein
VCLRCLKLSLVTALTSADRHPIVVWDLLRLPRLKLSRRVRFTNRFTKQTFDLEFPVPFRGGRPWMRAPCPESLSGLAFARRVASGRARRRAARCPVVITAAGSAVGRRSRNCPAQTPPPNPTAAEPDGSRVQSRVDAADHAVTPRRSEQVPAGVNTPTVGSGETTTFPTPHTFCRHPIFPSCTIDAGATSSVLHTCCLARPGARRGIIMAGLAREGTRWVTATSATSSVPASVKTK